MNSSNRKIIRLVFASAVMSAALTGCDKKADTVTQAGQADKKTGIAAPSIEEVKAIAEEGFIYSLPLVMNYTANYEFWVDKKSKQYKAPFNQLKNERRVFTYEDNRYLINSPMLPGMKKNADGSLTIHIAKDSPGAELESNWLPAPDGPIYLVMRLYWPKTESPSILPPGKGEWAPPAVQMVK